MPLTDDFTLKVVYTLILLYSYQLKYNCIYQYDWQTGVTDVSFRTKTLNKSTPGVFELKLEALPNVSSALNFPKGYSIFE